MEPTTSFNRNVIGASSSATERSAWSRSFQPQHHRGENRQQREYSISFNGGDGIRVLSASQPHRGQFHYANSSSASVLGSAHAATTPATPMTARTIFKISAPHLRRQPRLPRRHVNSAANADFSLQFFANTACDSSGFGEGELYLGSLPVTTDGSGNAAFTSCSRPSRRTAYIPHGH